VSLRSLTYLGRLRLTKVFTTSRDEAREPYAYITASAAAEADEQIYGDATTQRDAGCSTKRMPEKLS